MKKINLLFVISLMVVTLIGCGKSVKRVDVEKQIDLSGKWNDTDSRLVSEQMIQDCLNRPWLADFKTEKGKSPVVIVGSVINKSDEHINTETFTKDLERELINSGKVDFVASKNERSEVRQERLDMQKGYTSAETMKAVGDETGADYMLKGVLNSINDKEGRKSVSYYQIDLELIDMESNRKAWIGNKKIKKYIKD